MTFPAIRTAEFLLAACKKRHEFKKHSHESIKDRQFPAVLDQCPCSVLKYIRPVKTSQFSCLQQNYVNDKNAFPMPSTYTAMSQILNFQSIVDSVNV